MVKLCSNCKKEIKSGKNFCGFCGTPVKIKERRCNKCNELLEDGENFCSMCGEKYTEAADIEPTPALTIEKESLLKGTLVNTHESYTLRFLKGTGEDEKKTVRALNKEVSGGRWNEGLFLHNKDEKLVFIRRKDSSFIEGYSYNNNLIPFCIYTVFKEVDHVWENSRYAQEYCYFFHNLDAFFVWDSYIFMSIYEGKIAWSAADGRDACNLPNKQADVTMYAPGRPELEFLPNVNIKSTHFYNNAECKLVKGVFIPI